MSGIMETKFFISWSVLGPHAHHTAPRLGEPVLMSPDGSDLSHLELYGIYHPCSSHLTQH